MTPKELFRAADILRHFGADVPFMDYCVLADKLDQEADDINALGTECARLKAELEEARKDTALLDWLDANPRMLLRSGKQHIRPLICAAIASPRSLDSNKNLGTQKE